MDSVAKRQRGLLFSWCVAWCCFTGPVRSHFANAGSPRSRTSCAYCSRLIAAPVWKLSLPSLRGDLAGDRSARDGQLTANAYDSHFLSPAVLEQDAEDKAEYRSAIVDVLAFAIEKLNDKAVYANTLVFSGRILGEPLPAHRRRFPSDRLCSARFLSNRGCRHQAASRSAGCQAPIHQACAR